MTRNLSILPRRRLLRAPAAPRRTDHAGDSAPLELRIATARPPADAEAASRVGRAGPDADRALQSLALENAMLARELGRVQRRCSQWRDDCVAQVEQLEAALMRSRAAVIARDTRIAALRDALEATAAPSVRPRRVLCVGGRARQVPVYRALVERRGGTLDHVDGSSSDDLGRLERVLAEADVVILQAGYACDGACRVVERHCALHGKQCIWLDKPCALGFERSLAQAVETTRQA